MPVDSGDFALLSRRVVDQINLLPERHRYIRGLRSWVGFPQTGIPVERDARAGGEPSYTLRKLFRLAFDGVFAFSVAPLRAAWVFGACVSALASLYALWAIFQRLFLGDSPAGLHRFDRRDHVLRGRPAALPRADRRVPGPRLRRGEGPAPLRRHGGRRRWPRRTVAPGRGLHDLGSEDRSAGDSRLPSGALLPLR